MPDAQTATDPRIADLTQAGKIRVALYPPQYAKDETGELRGWTIELGRALAEGIGVEFVPVQYPTTPGGTCGCVGINPSRSDGVLQENVRFSGAGRLLRS